MTYESVARARPTVMWGLTAVLSLALFAEWSLVGSVLAATAVAAAVLAIGSVFCRDEVVAFQEGASCSAPRKDAPYFQRSGSPVQVAKVETVAIVGGFLSLLVLALALAAPYLAATFAVWLVSGAGDRAELGAAGAMVLMARLVFLVPRALPVRARPSGSP